MDKRDKIIEQQAEIIKQQAEEIRQLKARIAELERMLGLDSTNSSKPPSSDGLKKKATTGSLREKSGKPSGGQVGHKGHFLKQVEKPNSVIIHRVKRCSGCGKNLRNYQSNRFVKRQVFDIPEPKTEVAEHRAQVKICPCGHKTTASFPEQVNAPAVYGPRIRALAIYFANGQLIPGDRLEQTFNDVFSLPISSAAIEGFCQNFAQKISDSQNKELERLKKTLVKHLDETGFRVGGQTCWLHVISDQLGTVYRAERKRKSLLSDVSGIVVHDHWKPYFQMPNVEHALCNAHHLRELKAFIEIDKEPWAKRMYRLLCICSRLKDPPVDRINRLFDSIVERGLSFHEQQAPLEQNSRKRRSGHNFLIRMNRGKEDVLRFINNPLVPFTNNQAEQDLRMMKVKQKISGGFRSLSGARIFCLIRGFLSTIRKRGQNIFQSIQAVYSGVPG